MSEEKKKAKELVYKFTFAINDFTGGAERHTVVFAKRLADVCVDELIKEHTHKSPISWNVKQKKYWETVKSEIEKL